MIRTYTVSTTEWHFALDTTDHGPSVHDQAENLTLEYAKRILDGHARNWRAMGLRVWVDERCVVAAGDRVGCAGWVWPSGSAPDEAYTDQQEFVFVPLELPTSVLEGARRAMREEGDAPA